MKQSLSFWRYVLPILFFFRAGAQTIVAAPDPSVDYTRLARIDTVVYVFLL